MAIDPNIALSVRPMEPLDITKLQQLRNLAMQEQATAQSISASQAQEALLRAQLPGVALQQERLAAEIPGVRAQSFIQQTEAEALKLLQDNPEKVYRMYPDGTQQVSFAGAINLLASKGFVKQAQGIAATELDNTYKALVNARTDQDRQVAGLNANNSIVSSMSLLLHALPETERASALESYAKYADSKFPGSGTAAAQLFTTRDPKTGVQRVDPERVKAIRESTITALSQEELAWQKTQQIYSSESNNPNSNLTRSFYAYAAERGVQPPPGLSFYQLERLGYGQLTRQFISSDRVPQEVRATALVSEEQARQQVEKYSAALKILEGISPSVLPTVAGSTLTEFFKSKILQDPQIEAFKTAISVHNADPKNKNDQISLNQTVAAAGEKIRAAATAANITAESYKKVAERKVLPESSTKPQRMVSMQYIYPDGKKGPIIQVPENEMDDARKAGLVPVRGGK